METLTYRQLLNFTVALLYELKLKRKITGFISLSKLVKFLNYEASFDEIKEIARYLEAQGFVKAVFSYGDVFIELSTRGIIHVEETDKNLLNTLHEYLKLIGTNLDIFAHEVNVNKQGNAKEDLINELELFRLDVDKRNLHGQWNDYIQDIIIIITELKKDKPDNEFLNNKANKLIENLTFRGEATAIVSKLNVD